MDLKLTTYVNREMGRDGLKEKEDGGGRGGILWNNGIRKLEILVLEKDN